MMLEPESWTGLRSSQSVSDHFDAEAGDDPAAGAPRSATRSVLGSVATRLGGFVDRAKRGRARLRRSVAGDHSTDLDFLRERRVMMIPDDHSR